MALFSTLYARPSDLLASISSLTVTAGTVNSLFPLANIRDGKSYNVFKASTTTLTLRAQFSSAKTFQGIALHNHNLPATASITVTNAAGFSNALAVAAVPDDGHRLDPWDDYRGLPNTSSDDWSIAITNCTSPIAIGELALVETWRTLPIQWGLTDDEAHPTIMHDTDAGVKLRYSRGTRSRPSFRGMVTRDAAATDLLNLQRSARGAFSQFPLIKRTDENDARWVDLSTDLRRRLHVMTNLTRTDVVFEEQQKGLAL